MLGAEALGVRVEGQRGEDKRKEEAHTEEALSSSEETAGRFLADGVQLLNSNRRNSGREPLW